MPEQSAGEKTEQATPHRKQEARKKGTVAKSPDLAGALGLLVVGLMGPSVFSGLSKQLLGGMAGSIGRIPEDVSTSSLMRFGFGVLGPCAAAITPLFAAMMAVGLAANFAQVGFVLSTESINPSLEKLNPLPGLKRLFSVKSTFEGLKAMAKMFLFGMVAYSAVTSSWGELVNLSVMTPAQAASVVGSMTHTILIRIAVVWLVISVADYFFQRKQTDKQLMMSKDELRREMREQEGSPEVKSAQMQRRRRLAKGGLASKLKEADVLITNPTHYAVAVKYERGSMTAPVVLAKGADFLALRMREIANDLDVPLVENKPLARALYKHCEAGDFVPRDLFAPVAEVLAYVYQTTKNLRGKSQKTSATRSSE